MNEDEVPETFLSGAELYEQLAAQTSEQLQSTETKHHSYTVLAETLQTLSSRRHHSTLAPVGNGLAYFEAQLCHTNEVLVLLGDNWFAERTVPQAVSICQRRLAFLENERRRLVAEQADVQSKLAFFRSEFSGGGGGGGRDPVATRQAPAASASSTALLYHGAAASDETEGCGKPSNNIGGAADGSGGDDDDGCGFVSEDELTDAELQCLEDAIQPTGRLGDDAYVEQRMLDMMLEKRAARLHREGLVFGTFGEGEASPSVVDDAEAAAAVPRTGMKPWAAPSPSAPVTEGGSSGGVAVKPKFYSPADIGSLHDSGSSGGGSGGPPTCCDSVVASTAPLRVAVLDDATPTPNQRKTSGAETAEPTTGKRSVSFAPLPHPSPTADSNRRGGGGSMDGLLRYATTTTLPVTVRGGAAADADIDGKYASRGVDDGGWGDEVGDDDEFVDTRTGGGGAAGAAAGGAAAFDASCLQHSKHSGGVPAVTTSALPSRTHAVASATRYDPLGEVKERSRVPSAPGTNRGQPGSTAAASMAETAAVKPANNTTTAGRSLFMQRMLGEGHR